MNQPLKKRPAGRQALDGATNVERVTVTLESEQRPILRRLGGSAWVRQKIREAEHLIRNPETKG